MNLLDQQIASAQKRLSSLQVRAGDQTPGLLTETLIELSASLEELSITAEELRAENDELLAAREMVEQGRKRYQELFDRAPDGYVVTDPKGHILELNHAASVMFGNPHDFLAKRPLVTLVVPEDRKIFRDAFSAFRTGAPPREIALRMRHGTDESFDALVHVDCDFDSNGILTDLRWLVIDVSERERAMRELRRRDALLEATAFGAERLLRAPRWEQVMNQVLKGVGRAARASRAYVIQTEETSEHTILARHRFEWTQPDVPSVSVQIGATELPLERDQFGRWLAALETGQHIQVSHSTLPPQAQSLLEVFGIRSVLVVPIFVESEWWGMIVLDDCLDERTWSDPEIETLRTAAEIVGAAIYRSEVEQSLERSEELFRRLAENAQDVVYRYRIRPKRGFEYVSPAVTAVNGYTPEEHYADPDLGYKIVHPDDVDLLGTSLNPTVRTLGEPMVIRWIRKDGSLVWTEQRTVPLLDSKGSVVAIEGIARDITDRKIEEEHLIGDLKRERDLTARMQEVDDAKTAIVRAAGHDLRNPLTSLLGFALTLQSRFDDLAAPERGEILDRMVQAARRLDRGLESDLIEIERISAGVVGPVRVSTDIAVIARRVVFALDEPGHDITLDLEPVTINVDRVKVERIIENLLSNAIKHTPPGSRIWLRLRRDQRGARIVVEDDGPGVPDSEESQIFEAFHRGSDAGAVPGHGIGLSLVQRLAELHGGDAWVERRAGGGASFVVTLPEAPAGATPDLHSHPSS
jgi:PAS domain S-box-containing protein